MPIRAERPAAGYVALERDDDERAPRTELDEVQPQRERAASREQLTPGVATATTDPSDAGLAGQASSPANRRAEQDHVQQTSESAAAGEEAAKPDWWAPPVKDNTPIDVKFRFNVTSLADVKTKECEAFVQIQVVFFWTDYRLESWCEGEEGYSRKLPGELWGPALVLNNGKDVVPERKLCLHQSVGYRRQIQIR